MAGTVTVAALSGEFHICGCISPTATASQAIFAPKPTKLRFQALPAPRLAQSPLLDYVTAV